MLPADTHQISVQRAARYTIWYNVYLMHFKYQNSLHLNVSSLEPLSLTLQSKARVVQNRHVRAIEQRGLDPDICGKFIYTAHKT